MKAQFNLSYDEAVEMLTQLLKDTYGLNDVEVVIDSNQPTNAETKPKKRTVKPKKEEPVEDTQTKQDDDTLFESDSLDDVVADNDSLFD